MSDRYLAYTGKPATANPESPKKRTHGVEIFSNKECRLNSIFGRRT
jgi:hypothetical protein